MSRSSSSEALLTSSGGRGGSPGGLALVERWATYAALATVGVFVVWALIRAGEIAGLIYQNADASSALVLAEFFDERGSGSVVLGYFWLEPLYALRLTGWLPAHHQVWEAGPFIAYAATVGLVGWTVMRSTSRRAGLLVALAMAAPAPVVLRVIGTPVVHQHTLTHAAILAAFLITLPRLAAWGTGRRALWGTALAVILAPGASSDIPLILGGVVPFLVAVIYGWRTALVPRGSAIVAATACLAGAAGGLLLRVIAEHDMIIANPGGEDFPPAPLGEALGHVPLLLEVMALFVHGRVNGPFDAWELELIAFGAMVAVAILGFVIFSRMPTVLRDRSRPAQQRLLATYWGAALLVLGGAFIVSTAPRDIYAVRYVTLFWPALLTLAVITFSRRALTVIALTAAASAVLGCVELGHGTYTQLEPFFPLDRDVERLERFVSGKGVDHGYAGYWDAATITAKTDFEVRTYPLQPCGPTGDGRCPFGAHHMDSWYLPKNGVRSFYVVHDEGGGDPLVGEPPARWGAPAEEAQIGALRILIYDYDLAYVLPQGTLPPRCCRQQGDG
jgi:hypothetical protein